MLPAEIAQAVKRIQFVTGRQVSDVMAGAYLSVFKGRGMEFDEVRPYVPGDDVRTIDWNVTARTGVPHVKRFVEERELTVMLLVDASASTHFGTVKQLKSEMAAELAAVFAFSAITNNDKVGLVMFSDQIELAVRPKKGTRHVLRVIREVLSFTPRGRGTNLGAALEHLGHVTKRRCVTFVISDFLDPAARAPLKLANRRHDVIGVVLDDPRDLTFPDIGLIELEDAETGEHLIVDTGDARVRREFEARARAARDERARMLRTADVDRIVLSTDRPYAEALMGFFRMRERRH